MFMSKAGALFNNLMGRRLEFLEVGALDNGINEET